MKKIESFVLGLNLFQIVAGCDVELLEIPVNGKSWNFNADRKIWELECKINYEIEAVSPRYFHRCRPNNSWSWPSRVVVKCRFSSEVLHEEILEMKKLEEKMEALADEMAEEKTMTVGMADAVSQILEIVRDDDESLVSLTSLPPNEKAILVLNTKPFEAKPLVFDIDGNVNNDLNWDYRELTTAFFGCTTAINGELFYFGGVGADSRQASKVDNCGLTRLPDLSFDFEGGSCLTIQPTDTFISRVYFCFGDTENKRCRMIELLAEKFDGTGDYPDAANSTYGHSFVELAQYKKQPFVTGSFERLDISNAQTEILEDGQWTEVDPYPYGQFIAFYSTVSTEDSVYIVGGRQQPQGIAEDQYTNILAKYNGSWSTAGELLYQRVGHASILIESILYIFGGSVRNSAGFPESNAYTEKWDFSDINQPSSIGVMLPAPKSRDYQFGIALFEVDNDPLYCPTADIKITVQAGPVIEAIEIGDKIFGFCLDNKCDSTTNSSISIPNNEYSYVESITYGRSENETYLNFPCALTVKVVNGGPPPQLPLGKTYGPYSSDDCNSDLYQVDIPSDKSLFKYFEQNVKTRSLNGMTFFDGFDTEYKLQN